MLKRNSSLAARAAIAFGIVLVTILLALVGTNAAMSGGAGDWGGPNYAIRYAAAEMTFEDGRPVLPGKGRLMQLLDDNPAMWVLARKDDRTYRLGTAPPSARRLFSQVADSVDRSDFEVPELEGRLGYSVLEKHRVGSGTVVLAAGGIDPRTLSDRSALDLLFGPEVLLALIVISAVSLVAMAIAIPFFTRAVKPIASAAGSIGPHSPDRRLGEEATPKELLPLVRGFNAALDRLERELGRRKRFIADAAHELRTPLAVVSLQVEGLDEGEGKTELRRSLNRMTHIVSQMLDLERLSLSEGQRVEVDLVAVARDLVADLAPMAIREGYDLTLSAPDDPVLVTGDPNAIARALTNLIGNSVVHGGGSGQVAVVVGRDRTVDVIDEGPGVPAELEPRLFEPFSRGNANLDGCGLGLHLTREIMTAHGGEACLLPSPEGAAFRLSFPPVVGRESEPSESPS